jgi:hypothetical protein
MKVQHLTFTNPGMRGRYEHSQYCRACEIDAALLSLAKLLHNIIIGAALCQAFDLGEISLVYATGFGELEWRPGCGVAVPNRGGVP